METRIYLDHAATTPLREVARTAWLENAHHVNPGGSYAAGRAARRVLEDARESIAGALGAEPIEVMFTGSGTEADNMAVTGLWRGRNAEASRPGLTVSPMEHPAVAEPARALVQSGALLELLPITPRGVIDLEGAPAVIHPTTALVACMLANNETGRIQPVAKLGQLCQDAGVPLHVDAVQAVGHIPVNVRELGATTLALSAHKFGGPRGVGVLVARRSPAPSPVLLGGGQERGLRPGTVNVAGAAATAAALAEAVSEQKTEARSRSELRVRLLDGICATVPDVIVHSARDDGGLPGHVHVSFPGLEGDSLLMLLDSHGIACSTGSACSQGVNRPSETLLAMGIDEPTARGAIRFTLGRTTTGEDIDELLAVLPQAVRMARNAGMA